MSIFGVKMLKFISHETKKHTYNKLVYNITWSPNLTKAPIAQLLLAVIVQREVVINPLE